MGFSGQYVSLLFSQIISPSPSPTMSRNLFFMFVSPALFFRFHIVSEVRQHLSISACLILLNTLQVHPCCHRWQDFILFLWLSNFPLYISSLSIHLFLDTEVTSISWQLKKKKGCSEHRGSYVILNWLFPFLQINTQEWNCWIIWQFYF